MFRRVAWWFGRVDERGKGRGKQNKCVRENRILKLDTPSICCVELIEWILWEINWSGSCAWFEWDDGPDFPLFYTLVRPISFQYSLLLIHQMQSCINVITVSTDEWICPEISFRPRSAWIRSFPPLSRCSYEIHLMSDAMHPHESHPPNKIFPRNLPSRDKHTSPSPNYFQFKSK